MYHLRKILSRLKAEKLYVFPKKNLLLTNWDWIPRNAIEPWRNLCQPWEGPDRAWMAEVLSPHWALELHRLQLQFFRRFVKTFSRVAAPLTALTKKGVRIGKWENDCDEAFEQLKGALISAPILVSPQWIKPFRCHVDAIQSAVGGTLTQVDENGVDRVIAYFSKELSDAE